MSNVELEGCRPEPLAGYLKALGVLRLMVEQGADPDARGHWTEGDTFRLGTSLSRDSLVAFLLDEYRPTPLVAPWNGGSGFDGRIAGIGDIEASAQERLKPYRDTITAARRLLHQHPVEGKDGKRDLLEACRGELPDEAVEWIDAAAVLTDGDPVYPPLLGTGGNLGRLELSNNFMQRVADVLCLRTGRGAPGRAESQQWLEACLFADRAVPHLRASAGQFDPGRAGGILSSPLEKLDDKGFVNPWEFVLGLEGALCFASAAARRLEAAKARPSVPFMVAASPVGYASSAPEEGSKGELWAPLWRRPATFGEVARLIGEGRAEWRGRQASHGVDVARAATSLGVDRGVDAFVRHVFVERHGQNMLAVPVGRVEVRHRPGVTLLAAVDDWLAGARRGSNPPAGVATALRRVEAAMYDISAVGSTPGRMQSVLATLAEAEIAVGRSTARRERSKAPPVRLPSPRGWLDVLDDGTSELRLAAALASGRDEDGTGLRALLRPIRRRQGGVLEWTERPPLVPGFGAATITDVLAMAHVRRMIERAAAAGSVHLSGEANQAERVVGVQTAFRWALPCPVGDVARFLAGETDDDRLGELLAGLLLVDFDRVPEAVASWPLDEAPDQPLDPAWRVLAPFFHWHVASTNSLAPQVEWPAQLAAGRVVDVVDDALSRLRISGRDPAVHGVPPMSSAHGSRLTTALLARIPAAQLRKALESIAPPRTDRR